jgi:Zn-dependent M28 family amino/carboxypeptidase
VYWFRFEINFSNEIDYPMTVTSPLGGASDHWPFFMAGIPTVEFATGPSDPLSSAASAAKVIGFGHTSADTVDKVDLRGLKESSMVLAQFLLRIVNEEKPLAGHTSVEEILKRLEDEGEAEALRVQKKWYPESIR